MSPENDDVKTLFINSQNVSFTVFGRMDQVDLIMIYKHYHVTIVIDITDLNFFPIQTLPNGIFTIGKFWLFATVLHWPKDIMLNDQLLKIWLLNGLPLKIWLLNGLPLNSITAEWQIDQISWETFNDFLWRKVYFPSETKQTKVTPMVIHATTN